MKFHQKTTKKVIINVNVLKDLRYELREKIQEVKDRFSKKRYNDVKKI